MQVIDAPFLMVIPPVFVFLALATWMLTLFGLVHQLRRS